MGEAMITQIEVYHHWLRARGQLVVSDACFACGFRPQGRSRLRVCYHGLQKDEQQLLRRVVPTLRPFQQTRLRPCPAAAEQLCELQRHDLCQVEMIVLLGNGTAQLVGVARNFARQQGQIYRVAGWEKVMFMLTLHPADLHRYPPALQLWQQDLQRAGLPVVAVQHV